MNKIRYDIDDYSTWDIEALLNHMVYLSDCEVRDGEDNSEAMIKISDELEERKHNETPYCDNCNS